jgi:23S rRNA (adenine2503-C2)-methyltransferase
MDLQRAQTALAEHGEPSYRLKQVKAAVYRQLVSSWDEALTLPPTVRTMLSERAPISSLEIVRETVSERGDTEKVAFKLVDGNLIETVLMKHAGGRNTICVSSQAGCPMRCSFCATGTMGLKRNLTAEEIVDQVLHFARKLKTRGETVTNMVYMGMGEPMHNYDNVMAATRTLNDQDGFCLGARRMSISTCGIVSGIDRLTQEDIQVNLAVSLHAPNDALRTRLMPVNMAYPLGKLMPAIEAYVNKTKAKVFFEYLLIDNVNDMPEVAEELATLLKHPLYHVNLIKYHTTGAYTASSKERRMRFMRILQDREVSVTHRITFGEDIDAACGQLANKENAKASAAPVAK